MSTYVPQIILAVLDLLHAVVLNVIQEPHPFASFFTHPLEQALILACNSADENVRLKVGSLFLAMIRGQVLTQFSFDEVLYPQLMHFVYHSDEFNLRFH